METKITENKTRTEHFMCVVLKEAFCGKIECFLVLNLINKRNWSRIFSMFWSLFSKRRKQ